MIRELAIVGAPLAEVEIMPQNTLREIAQNVRCILTTRRGSLALDRAFGVNAEMVDKMQTTARQLLEADIIMTLQKYEPRVKVTGISWERQESAADGTLYPKVLLTVKEGVL